MCLDFVFSDSVYTHQPAVSASTVCCSLPRSPEFSLPVNSVKFTSIVVILSRRLCTLLRLVNGPDRAPPLLVSSEEFQVQPHHINGFISKFLLQDSKFREYHVSPESREEVRCSAR